MNLCLNAFTFLLGISSTDYYAILHECRATRSLSTKVHGLTRKSGSNSNRFESELHETTRKAFDAVVGEHSIEPPWFIKLTSTEKPVKIMPSILGEGSGKHNLFLI